MRVVAFLGVLTVAVAAFGAEAEDAELRAARSFESAWRLRVVAATPTPDPDPKVWVEECIAGYRRVVGTTPSAAPLEIPPCTTWFVEILDASIDDVRFADLAAELREKDVPGLSLLGCKRLTDNAMKSLADHAGLEYLDLRGCRIGGTGVAHLTRGVNLRFIDIDQRGYTGVYWSKKFKDLEAIDARGLRNLLGPELRPFASPTAGT